MPRIRLRLFASLREQTGLADQTLELAATTVADARTELAARGPAWQALTESARVRAAVNQLLADESQALAPGDELAFFPPVTGG